MKFGRSACLAGLVALGAWSMAACSSDKNNGNGDGGTPDGGGNTSTGGKTGTGGSTSNGGTAGKTGTGGNGGSTGGKTGTGGTTTNVDGGFDGGVPSVKITEPKDKATVGPGSAYPDFPKIPITFVVANFVLKAPMTPTSQCPLGSCGHVHINVDGTACDTAGAPYNNAGISSPLAIDLGLCPKSTLAGAHTVTISLHNTDHSDVKDAGGHLISDEILIDVAGVDGGVDGGAKKDGG